MFSNGIRKLKLNKVFFSVDEDDVIWALGVALMVVMIAGSLCLLVKCNANMLNRRKKKKVRAAERRKSMKKAKQEAAAAAAKLEIEKEKNKAEKAKAKAESVRAISKSNPQQHRIEQKKPKSKKDFIIDIIDSALDGDMDANDNLLKYSSSESIDGVGGLSRLRRASDTSVTLSLVFDAETDKPVFRRL